jgi:hypothetical protein
VFNRLGLIQFYKIIQTEYFVILFIYGYVDVYLNGTFTHTHTHTHVHWCIWEYLNKHSHVRFLNYKLIWMAWHDTRSHATATQTPHVVIICASTVPGHNTSQWDLGIRVLCICKWHKKHLDSDLWIGTTFRSCKVTHVKYLHVWRFTTATLTDLDFSNKTSEIFECSTKFEGQKTQL